MCALGQRFDSHAGYIPRQLAASLLILLAQADFL